MTDLQSQRNLIMGTIAAQAALGSQAAAQALYEAGGKKLLAGAVQSAVRRACTRGALDVVSVMAPTLLVEGVAETTAAAVPAALRELTVATGKAAVAETARAAGGQILRGAVRVGGVGLLIDGAFGAVAGIRGYRRGTMTGKQAALHTATEAGTGAVSTATGVALAAGVIALTGGLAAPAVVAIGAGGALATKLGLGRLLTRKPKPTATDAATSVSSAALPAST